MWKSKTEEQCLRGNHVDRPLKHCKDLIDFQKSFNKTQLGVFQKELKSQIR